jgi:hypothetical protein
MDLMAATSQVEVWSDHLHDAINKFDEQKPHDLKNCLEEMIWAEMEYHAKLKILTIDPWKF